MDQSPGWQNSSAPIEPAGDIIAPKANRHSYFWTDPSFGGTVDDLIKRVDASSQHRLTAPRS